MKTIYKHVFLVSLTVVICNFLCSCNDFLNENPESTYTTESFYTSQKDFKYAITSIYSEQQTLYDGQYGLLRVNNTRSDDTDCDDFNTYSDGYATFSDNAAVQATREVYSALYVMITRANSILIRIDDVEFSDKNMKKYIKGEAYALRGWAYHTLGVLFGGVPLVVDAEYSVAETREIGRSTQQETFAQAISDYQKAYDLLPISWDSENVGRVTKYAAKAMEGRLLMFEGNYSEAQTALKLVIDSNIYNMADEYGKCFHANYENQPANDRIWEVQYIGGQLGEG